MTLRTHHPIDRHLARELSQEANSPRSRKLRTASDAARAVGALALGAIAIGAVAIGTLAIGKLAIGRARVRRLEIDELVVRQLRVTEHFQAPPSPDPES